MIRIRPVLALSIAGALVLSACGSDDDGDAAAATVTPTVNVGRTNDPLSQLMAEIYGQSMEKSGYRVGRKDPVADQATAITRLEAGSFQLVSDTTTAALARVGTGAEAITADEQMTALREAVKDTTVVIGPAPVDNKLVVVCSGSTIDELALTNVTDLAASEATLGATPAFRDAISGGLAALNAAYGSDLTVTAVDDVPAAIVDGSVDCGVVPQLDPAIVVDGLIVLEDDQAFAASDSLVSMMTIDAAQPDVAAVIESVNATLTTDIVRSMLVKGESGDQNFDVIAKQFLASQSSGQ